MRIIGLQRRRAVTFQAALGERVVLGHGFEIERSSGFRLRGFHVGGAGGVSTVIASRRITITRADLTGAGIVMRGVRATTISDSRIHDLARPPGAESFAGYGIWANGYVDGGSSDGLDGLVVRRNVFRHIPQDAIQVGGGPTRVSHVTIDHNEFGFVRRVVEADHPDPIQILGGRHIVVRSNYFHDSEDAIIVSDDTTTGLRFENNLLVGWPGGCIQAQFWNTPGARIVGNTIWRSQCVGLRLASDRAYGAPPRGIVVRRNIVDSYAGGEPAWVAGQDANIIVEGPLRGPRDTRSQPALSAALRPVGQAVQLHAGSSVHVR